MMRIYCVPPTLRGHTSWGGWWYKLRHHHRDNIHQFAVSVMFHVQQNNDKRWSQTKYQVPSITEPHRNSVA